MDVIEFDVRAGIPFTLPNSFDVNVIFFFFITLKPKVE